MLLRTVVAGYLGATLVVAGTGVSAYKLLRARHASVDTQAVVKPQAEPLAAALESPAAAPPGQAGPSPNALPPLRPPSEQHASVARPRLPHQRAPLSASSREPSHHPVRAATATGQAARPHLHPAAHPIRYPVYYRVYYPYAYYGYYPPYPSS
jgi:hypothetical protein